MVPDNSYLDDFIPANKKITCSDESSFDDVNKFMEMSANDLEATLSASGVGCVNMKIQSNLDEPPPGPEMINFQDGPPEKCKFQSKKESVIDNKDDS